MTTATATASKKPTTPETAGQPAGQPVEQTAPDQSGSLLGQLLDMAYRLDAPAGDGLLWDCVEEANHFDDDGREATISWLAALANRVRNIAGTINPKRNPRSAWKLDKRELSADEQVQFRNLLLAALADRHGAREQLAVWLEARGRIEDAQRIRSYPDAVTPTLIAAAYGEDPESYYQPVLHAIEPLGPYNTRGTMRLAVAGWLKARHLEPQKPLTAIHGCGRFVRLAALHLAGRGITREDVRLATEEEATEIARGHCPR